MNIPDIYKNFSKEEVCINYLEKYKVRGKANLLLLWE